ncbi:MFS transporter [Paraferrimonas sedimenticola]|uniref:Major facilitator superfamily (MFS) profile domain-containing protein n=1 Tax=Paraferrimonas sedimenticola TaxID=375674 RepID=A0AA37RW88_9GAMM|nr:MFS transporter [Paraferrimonas sedimenticola]GLP96381.1 hypothetical protein GCM10007895_16870 [Paraferrimonas sedimenticola]
MTDQTATPKKFLGIHIESQVSAWNMSTFYLTCVATILLGAFINGFHPFLFTEMMGIPQDQHGVVSGKLNFAGEMAIIASVGIWGALSDKIGRKWVMTFGFAILALTFYLYPTAQTVNELLIYRCIYGVGISAATCMIVTLLADYAKDVTRGKAAGLQGVCNGIGAMVALFVLLRLPQIFQSQGQTAVEAGFATYHIVVGICIVLAIVSFIGLKGHIKKEAKHDLPLAKMIYGGVKAAKDPGIALAYGAAFVSRANLTIVGAFMTLWLSNYGVNEAGMNSADALKKAGMIVGIAQGVTLLGAPIFGILADKINRVNCLVLATTLTFLGYCGTYFITDPFGSAMMIIVVLIGLAEIGGIISSGVLIAQQTSPKNRGAVIGIFNLSGAIGILISSIVGGYLFDHWNNAGPFVFVGLCGLTVTIWALIVKNKVVPYAEREKTPEEQVRQDNEPGEVNASLTP